MAHHKKDSKQLIFQSLAFLALVFSSSAWSITPLDEQGMDDVSAETSSIILDVYGPAAAGIRIDGDSDLASEISVESGKTAHQEGKEVASTVDNRLDEITRDAASTSNVPTNSSRIDSSLINEAIASTTTRKQTNTLNSSNEVAYNAANQQRESKRINRNEVAITNEAGIDLLRLQGLQFNERTNPSLGNINLSTINAQATANIKLENR